jgi:hypothetical protein
MFFVSNLQSSSQAGRRGDMLHRCVEQTECFMFLLKFPDWPVFQNFDQMHEEVKIRRCNTSPMKFSWDLLTLAKEGADNRSKQLRTRRRNWLKAKNWKDPGGGEERTAFLFTESEPLGAWDQEEKSSYDTLVLDIEYRDRLYPKNGLALLESLYNKTVLSSTLTPSDDPQHSGLLASTAPFPSTFCDLRKLLPLATE